MGGVVYFDRYYKIVLSSQSNEVSFPLLHPTVVLLLGVGKHPLSKQWASSYDVEMSHCFFALICLLLALVHFSLYCWFLTSWLQEHFIYYLPVLSFIWSVFCGIYLLTLLILAPLEIFYFHVIKLIIGF